MNHSKHQSKLLEVAFKWLYIEFREYRLYFDTPQNRFHYTPRSIWLINPKTNEWCFELENGGHLWYFYEVKKRFLEIFPIEPSEFELIIKMWVEDTLKRGVLTTMRRNLPHPARVEDTLKRGVLTTKGHGHAHHRLVEDTLKIGVSTTCNSFGSFTMKVEDVLKRGVSTTDYRNNYFGYLVEDALKRGVSFT